MHYTAFNSALLLALRAHFDTFDSEACFRRAYMVMVEEAKKLPWCPREIARGYRNPVFLSVPLAEGMISQGMWDGVVALLSPNYCIACFTITQDRAVEELKELAQEHTEDVRCLARILADEIRRR